MKQRGAWTVGGKTVVPDRILEGFASAEEEIVYMTVEELLTEDVIKALGEATDRGVSINLGGVSADVQDRIQDEIPGVTMFECGSGRIRRQDG